MAPHFARTSLLTCLVGSVSSLALSFSIPTTSNVMGHGQPVPVPTVRMVALAPHWGINEHRASEHGPQRTSLNNQG